MHASEMQHTQFAVNLLTRNQVRAASLLLVPSREEVANAFVDVVVNGLVRQQTRAVAEVRRPLGQEPVELLGDARATGPCCST
jgi:hypothetical protein